MGINTSNILSNYKKVIPYYFQIKAYNMFKMRPEHKDFIQELSETALGDIFNKEGIEQLVLLYFDIPADTGQPQAGLREFIRMDLYKKAGLEYTIIKEEENNRKKEKRLEEAIKKDK
jgi:hypothetical protein